MKAQGCEGEVFTCYILPGFCGDVGLIEEDVTFGLIAGIEVTIAGRD